ncbi:MAG: hypothetical protein HN394_09410 [Rhodospirillaceae bacterium]|nr:hypothetical protein [Rhodospirillaceae bacterium]MBT4689345.1 hypothetical protein [Rhodospirillaceae bacterium]MBT5081352.1 hypothetical protein [Rhodospirillaceae bacterium]MBT7286402.1 hypothetical protein [Rhodospirillaceae bacterium]MBT7665886.1 hypothetical protein [Rhodospirillaceae bacterium]
MQTLTKEQRRAWDIDGYVQLKGVFDAEEVAFFCDEIDNMRAQPGWEPTDLPRGHYGWVEHGNPDPESFMDRRDILPYHKAFRDLIDRPEVFDLVVDIMGPYLSFSMAQCIVRASDPEFLGYTHTDGGEGLRRVRVTESSRPLAMKALYLLTDVDGPDNANFTVFPGSHMRPFPELDEPVVTPTTPGAVPLTGKAGDCVIFSHSLWHGPGRNISGTARKTLLYNYCQMFVRPYDYAVASHVAEQCTPRQRRLLGDLGYDFRPGSYVYVPDDQVELITGQASQ